MSKLFPIRVVLETMNLTTVPQGIAEKSFGSQQQDLMELMCHVFPDYGRSDFPYMILGAAAKQNLIPYLNKCFPQLTQLDVSGVQNAEDWDRIIGQQSVLCGNSLSVPATASNVSLLEAID